MKNPVQCAAEEFDVNLTRLAALRVETLAAAEQFEIATGVLLQHEAKRIEAKLGPSHPRTARLNARLAAGLAVAQAIEVERQRYRIAVPDVAEKGALVHGRTVDDQGRGIAGLLVCLIDAKGSPIRELPDATTDDSGYFAHPLEPEQLERLQKRRETGVFLGVFTPRGRLVHRTRKPLALEEGARLFTEIVLNRQAVAEENQTSPPGEDETETRVVVVPSVIGLSEDEAHAALKRARLVVGKRETKTEAEAVGKVVAQDPPAGSKVPVGTAVNLVIGVAPQEKGVVVPKVTGIQLSSARRKLLRHKLALGKVTRRPSRKADIVLEQDPTAGARVPAGTAVNLVVGIRENLTRQPRR